MEVKEIILHLEDIVQQHTSDEKERADANTFNCGLLSGKNIVCDILERLLGVVKDGS